MYIFATQMGGCGGSMPGYGPTLHKAFFPLRCLFLAAATVEQILASFP